MSDIVYSARADVRGVRDGFGGEYDEMRDAAVIKTWGRWALGVRPQLAHDVFDHGD